MTHRCSRCGESGHNARNTRVCKGAKVSAPETSRRSGVEQNRQRLKAGSGPGRGAAAGVESVRPSPAGNPADPWIIAEAYDSLLPYYQGDDKSPLGAWTDNPMTAQSFDSEDAARAAIGADPKRFDRCQPRRRRDCATQQGDTI